ncbi:MULTISPECIES: hypothetical protein [unclassified Corynebacterium]|uniref:hypothetical protein n=1 Tax=unclassified Corynebacterium TaxID=2624378 RepID=UPI0035267809
MAAQPSVTTESEDSAAARANAEQEAIDNAAEAAATPAPGREDLEPAEPGFDDNTKWNQAAENDVSNTNSSSLLQKKLEEKCDGTAVNTLLWGSVQGTIVYNGKTYYATVKPPQKKLDCRVH